MNLDQDDRRKREDIIAHCLKMNAAGLNSGTSGNISVRHTTGLLISPTSLPYDTLEPEDIVYVDFDGSATGHNEPSSEWRFHRDILQNRPDINAIVHAHPNYCTTLAIMEMDIPPIHYMIAIFGGTDVRCAPYAIYGSEELSQLAVEAMEGRKACLLAHHGMIAADRGLSQAFWLAEQLEVLARQYHGSLQLGTPRLLDEQQIQSVIDKISGYGLSDSKEADHA